MKTANSKPWFMLMVFVMSALLFPLSQARKRLTMTFTAGCSAGTLRTAW
ncbi:MAG: hypothetical protein JRK53_06360 [Deltaproteobacteria bacterium]|nr:hypothetical protein [Deltaproteobacteria bacterium]